MQNTPTTQNFCNRKLWYDMKKKTDEQRHKKKKYIFCRLFFFLFPMLLALVCRARAVCMHTSVKIPIPKQTFIVRSRSLLAIIIRLADLYTCVCVHVCVRVCLQWKRLRAWTRRRIHVYTFMHICVRACVYIFISIYVHVRWARDQHISVYVF